MAAGKKNLIHRGRVILKNTPQGLLEASLEETEQLRRFVEGDYNRRRKLNLWVLVLGFGYLCAAWTDHYFGWIQLTLEAVRDYLQA